MLRDLPSVLRRNSNEPFFMTPSASTTQNEADVYQTNVNDLNDIFGSAPSSPNLDQQNGAGVREPSQTAHPSDIPRLRSIHVTSGYREGIAASKEQYIQEGFDEGFSLGGEIGLRAGYILGVLEGIHSGLVRKPKETDSFQDQASESVRGLLVQAQEQLDLKNLLGRDFFGPEGVWKYEVPGQKLGDVEGEINVSFSEVAASHPLLQTWKGSVESLADQHGIEIWKSRLSDSPG